MKWTEIKRPNLRSFFIKYKYKCCGFTKVKTKFNLYNFNYIKFQICLFIVMKFDKICYNILNGMGVY